MNDLPSFRRFVAEHENSLLLESSRVDRNNRHSYLFSNPLEILSASEAAEVPALFSAIEHRLQAGMYIAGFLSYECGYVLQDIADMRPSNEASIPLAWFGVFAEPETLSHELPNPFAHQSAGHPEISNLSIALDRDEYARSVERIRTYIADGDTYQVNYTTQADFHYSGSPEALYEELLLRQPVPFSAFAHVGSKYILSFSPELFFRLEGNSVAVRPMKGTARRGKNSAEDEQIRQWLSQDAKNRAENIMIVDLMRSDLGRISEIGSVKVESLFDVEKYKTLFQMTSTISAKLRPDVDWYQIFRSLFPSGSVTGAPKIRTMEIIHELEPRNRGVYTGAIGFISPRREAVFSVPIRTLVVADGQGSMGIGSGITYESIPDREYEECLLKARFLLPQPKFELIETLGWNGQYLFLEQHTLRLASSAEYFDFRFSRELLLQSLRQNEAGLIAGENYKVRVLLSPAGDLKISNELITPAQADTVDLAVSHARTDSEDPFLYHKTTQRDLYSRISQEVRTLGCEDAIFLNEKGEVTECANNNIFAKMNGRLLTPPLRCGVLPGIFRQHVLESDSNAAEQVLTLADLWAADELYICNSVRGMRRARLIQTVADDSSEAASSGQ